MSDAESKEVPRPPDAFPEAVGIGKHDAQQTARAGPRLRLRGHKRKGHVIRVVVKGQPRRRKRTLPAADLEGDVEWIIAQLLHKYPNWTKAAKQRVLSLIQRYLPALPKPGRPRRADVTAALRLEAEGVSRRKVYIRLGKSTRDAQHALREAMRQRKARKRRRDKSQAVTPTNSTPFCSV